MPNYNKDLKNQSREKIWTTAIDFLTKSDSRKCILSQENIQATIQEFNANSGLPNIMYSQDMNIFETNPIKDVSEIKVAYFAGPTPSLDAKVLVEKGVLTNNIYAFEVCNKIFKKAKEDLKAPKNRVVKNINLLNKNIIEFIKESNEILFDIVYLDFTKNNINEFQTLLNFLHYQRVNNHFVLITNYSSPFYSKNEKKIFFKEYAWLLLKQPFNKNYTQDLIDQAFQNLFNEQTNNEFANDSYNYKQWRNYNFFNTELNNQVNTPLIEQLKGSSLKELNNLYSEFCSAWNLYALHTSPFYDLVLQSDKRIINTDIGKEEFDKLIEKTFIQKDTPNFLFLSRMYQEGYGNSEYENKLVLSYKQIKLAFVLILKLKKLISNTITVNDKGAIINRDQLANINSKFLNHLSELDQNSPIKFNLTVIINTTDSFKKILKKEKFGVNWFADLSPKLDENYKNFRHNFKKNAGHFLPFSAIFERNFAHFSGGSRQIHV